MTAMNATPHESSPITAPTNSAEPPLRAGRNYELRPSVPVVSAASCAAIHASTRKKRTAAPGVPVYSPAQLDALFGEACLLNPNAMITLSLPTGYAPRDADSLIAPFHSLKRRIQAEHARRGFPRALIVTEFAAELHSDRAACAWRPHWHVALSRHLTADEQWRFRFWALTGWLHGTEHKRGQFDYREGEGGKQLVQYCSKDAKRVRKMHGKRLSQPMLVPTKFRPAWLPPKLPCRLWFCVGMKRTLSSRVGRKERRRHLPRRARLDAEAIIDRLHLQVFGVPE